MRALLLLVSLSFSLFSAYGQPSKSLLSKMSGDTLLPPMNLKVDSLTAKANWDWPSFTLLDENFEASDSLPEGWHVISMGDSTWYVTTDATSLNMYIQPHTHYIASSDFNAGQYNNGCCDRLVTPVLDFTLADSIILTFSSYYSGAFNERATIELSLDLGNSWIVIDTLEPTDPVWMVGWKGLRYDLSKYAGLPGSNHALLCFHADDNGQQASGWAIDDVRVQTFVSSVVSFTVWLDDQVISTTGNTYWQYDPGTLQYGHVYKAEVAANYAAGTSPPDSVYFHNAYLPYPRNLTAQGSDFYIILNWLAPLYGNTGLEDHLLHYNLYREDSLIAQIPASSLQYWVGPCDQGEYCFTLTAVYDITTLGFPAQTGESSISGPACYAIYSCCILPFFEPFTGGTYNLNHWDNGSNWIISGSEGNPLPCARFNNTPALNAYSSVLELYPRFGTEASATPHDIVLEFDLALADSLSNGSEKLIFEFRNEWYSWDTITTFTNHGSREWTHYIYRLHYPNSFGLFYFRVIATGENSLNIDHWLLDNISIYGIYSLNPPLSLSAAPSPGGIHDIHLEWTTPVDSLIYKNSSGTEDLLSYSVYRRSREPLTGDWELIGTVTTTWYDDTNLPENCYDYYVNASYREGDGVSNIDSLNCVTVGQHEESQLPLQLYPNPSSGYVRLIASEPLQSISLVDFTGKVKKDFDPKMQAQWIDLRSFPRGVYLLQFRESSGVLHSQKLFLTH